MGRVPRISGSRVFRMWGFPYTTLIGAGLMAAALLTTLFTDAFRPTLIYGVPFLILLSLAYAIQRRRAAKHSSGVVEDTLQS